MPKNAKANYLRRHDGSNSFSTLGLAWLPQHQNTRSWFAQRSGPIAHLEQRLQRLQ
jgi:hypothetical protein